MAATNVYLTSFFKVKQLPSNVEVFSAAVYPPKGYEALPKADWTDIRDSRRNWIRPRNYINAEWPLAAYRQALWRLYLGRQLEASAWLSVRQGDVALCCWCPRDRAAQEQLARWGSFVCHTAVLGEFIDKTFHVPVWYDADRLKLAVLDA